MAYVVSHARVASAHMGPVYSDLAYMYLYL